MQLKPLHMMLTTRMHTARDSRPALSIQHMERILGDRVFVDMMGGRQHRLVAAMKSLPLRDCDAPANSTPAEKELVALLTQECNAQLDGKHFMPTVYEATTLLVLTCS